MLGIKIPAGDVTKLPVIGRALIKGLTYHNTSTGETVTLPDEWENVVAIIGDVYFLDKWYKPGVPQIRLVTSVKEYIPIVQE